MNEIVKVCVKHGDLTVDRVYHRKNRNQYECRECMRDSEKKRPKRDYEGEFAEYHRKYSKKWRHEHKQIVNERVKQDRLINPEKYRAWDNNTRAKNIKSYRYKDVLNKHKISAEQYNEIFVRQNNLCAICNKAETRLGRSGEICRLSIDHCHTTNKIRGLLCHDCNTGLGKFKDDKNLLLAAITYLESHKHEN